MYSRISDMPSILNIYLWNEQMNILEGKKAWTEEIYTIQRHW